MPRISEKTSSHKSNLKQHKKFPTSSPTSIPTEIGSTGGNSTFQPIYLDDEVLSPNISNSAARLGIARSSYDSNPTSRTSDFTTTGSGVDFSSVLHRSRLGHNIQQNHIQNNYNYSHPHRLNRPQDSGGQIQSQAPQVPNNYSSAPQQQPIQRQPQMPFLEPRIAAADMDHTPYNRVQDDLYLSDEAIEEDADAKSIGGKSTKSTKSSKSVNSKSQKKKRSKSPFRNALNFFHRGGGSGSSSNSKKQQQQAQLENEKQKQISEKQQTFQQHQQQKQYLLQHQKRSLLSTGQDSLSTLGVDSIDGSMDLHASITNQVERAMYKQTSNEFASELSREEAFDHSRFFLPAQQASVDDYYNQPHFFQNRDQNQPMKRNVRRRQIFHHNQSTSAFSSSPSFAAWPPATTAPLPPVVESQPTLRPKSEPSNLLSASGIKAKKKNGIGIAPPPKNTPRIIVPSSSVDNNADYLKSDQTKFTIFVLLIQPKNRIFELIRIHYDPSMTTLKQLVEMIPENCTDKELSTQPYLGFCRPNARSSSNKALTNLSLTASVMARDGSCARIACGEVLAAIPEGFTYKETQVLAKHIMKNPKMQKLLSKKKKRSPLSLSRNKRSTVNAADEEDITSYTYNESKTGGSGGHLGITPRKSSSSPDTEAVAPSAVYSSSRSVQSTTSLPISAPSSPAMDKKEKERQKLQEKIRSSVSLTSDRSRNRASSGGNGNDGNRDRGGSGDVSCCSSITTTATPTRKKEGIDRRTSALHVVTNLEMKDKLHNLNSPVRPNRKNAENRIASPVASERKLDKFLESPKRKVESYLVNPGRKVESYLVSPGRTGRKINEYPNTIPEDEASESGLPNTGSQRKLDRYLEETSKKKSSSLFAKRDKKNAVNRLIVDNDDVSQNLASGQIHLDVNQLEDIKREAAEAAKAAAKIAAEAAFSKKMQELVQTLDLPEDEKNCLLDDDDASYYSAMSSAMSVAMSPLTSDASCDFPVNISITEQSPRAPSEVRLMGSQGARTCASEIKVISPFAPPSGAVLLSPLASQQMSHQGPKGKFSDVSSPPPPLSASTPDTVEIAKQASLHHSISTSSLTCTQSVSDDDYTELSLIAETMEGFRELAMEKVSRFVGKKTKTFGKVPSKSLKRKLHLKVMSMVCMVFLVSQGLSGMDENDDINNLSRELVFKDESAVSSTHDVVGNMGGDLKKFSLVDLQLVMLFFFVLMKGQKFLSKAKPLKRKRRTWKSRVIPVD